MMLLAFEGVGGPANLGRDLVLQQVTPGASAIGVSEEHGDRTGGESDARANQNGCESAQPASHGFAGAMRGGRRVTSNTSGFWNSRSSRFADG